MYVPPPGTRLLQPRIQGYSGVSESVATRQGKFISTIRRLALGLAGQGSAAIPSLADRLHKEAQSAA